MASITGITLSIPKVLINPSFDTPKLTIKPTCVKMPIIMSSRRTYLAPVRAAPEGLSEKIAASIESAKESCKDDPVSGECAAAWDEVEELSAASSHARDKAKDSDPLETYCKDNPETDECRTYED
ncbi:hypothetical protein QVD17_41079 [Tagetes erecta]|uniref:CP12 domain-containing protein n=1 Tax=Tagetes erecta TaxID=13708 RepID=A0AAD8NI87_TARER|nr:hypothetical protein QVD17_41079 [Tagetes erecta]